MRAVCGPEAAASSDLRGRGGAIGDGRCLLPRPQARQLALGCRCAAEERRGRRGHSSKARTRAVFRPEAVTSGDPRSSGGAIGAGRYLLPRQGCADASVTKSWQCKLKMSVLRSVMKIQ
ncbi:hypothetical protein NDU88_002856 [Pleurodeles waltl]|uniref:Uncharacterized protein n=1 Tax=Pleurodeles waltl TaxID=8319 RepID=A0AAV7UCP1_PLEWA|nr:hypothetical protein NDU88_002856 [Pleurodeles waltl]